MYISFMTNVILEMRRERRYAFLRITRETHNLLLKVKREGESFDHLLRRLLVEAGKYTYGEVWR